MVEEDLSGNKLKAECGLEKSKIDNDAEMCVKTQPPQTDTWQFYKDADGDLEFDKVVPERTGRSYGYRGNLMVNNNENIFLLKIPYRYIDLYILFHFVGAATGDSGGPIWFKNPKTSKNEVVGIVTSANGDPKKIGNKPVSTEGVIVGTKINEKILKWIKSLPF